MSEKKQSMTANNAINEVNEIATYLQGMADASGNWRLRAAAAWLDKLSSKVCGQGFIGCSGGHYCSLDHK